MCLPSSNARQVWSTRLHCPLPQAASHIHYASLTSTKTSNPRNRARLEEGRRVVLDAQLAAHGPHVRRRAPQLVPREVRVQVVPATRTPCPIVS